MFIFLKVSEWQIIGIFRKKAYRMKAFWNEQRGSLPILWTNVEDPWFWRFE